MKRKKLLTLIMSMVMLLTLLPIGTVFAEEVIEHNWSGSCYISNTHTVDIGGLISSDAVITEMQVTKGIGSPILSSVTPTYTVNSNSASLKFVTRVLSEPASDRIEVALTTQNYGNITVAINISLTGKYIVNISDVFTEDAVYDGNPHSGYSGIPVGTLTNGSAYGGSFEYTYATAEGTALTGAPTEVGSYIVTISVPADNSEYTGSLTLNFDIIEKAEASYQTEENGEWISGSFTEALANVYEGGEVKLIENINISETVTVAKAVTITSDGANSAKMITSSVNQHGYLLRIIADVVIEDVIIDGGSKNSVTASRALFAVGDGTNSGKLTLGSGAVVQNNNNTTTNGAGGGVCVILGNLNINGGQIIGNTAYSGGAAAVMAESCNVTMSSGIISGNKATNTEYSGGGGAIYISAGTVTVTGGSIIDNSADVCGGGIFIYTSKAAFKLSGGKISGSSAKYGAGIYISRAKLLELSGGTVTENAASIDGGGVYAPPDAVIAISGSATVYGNTCEKLGKDLYLLYSPKVTVGEMDSEAKVNIYTYQKPETGANLLVASPAEGYTVTQNDLNKLSYEDANYRLVLSNGNVVLTEKPLIKSYDKENKITAVKVLETKTYTVIFADYNADGTLNKTDIVAKELSAGENSVTTDLVLDKGDKIMLWSNIGEMKSLCEILTVE